MKGFFKKLSACALTLSLVASMGVSIFAQTEMSNMVFAGYDITDVNNPNKIYNEVINGKYTNKQVLVPVTPTWKVEGYEGVYPYAGYSRMYLEGKKQDITCYNNLFPQWETRRQDYMWQIYGDHIIYERQQTKVNGKTWTWDFGNPAFNIPDSQLLTPTARNAVVVKTEWKDYGFGPYASNGARLTADEQRMYSDFNVNAIAKWNELLSNDLSPARLSATDGNNRYLVSDAEIAALIPVVQSKYVTAKFSQNSNAGLATKSVAAEYLKHMNDGWAWDADSFGIVHTATVSWTAPYYEMDEPYKYYQCLIVNGVVMDGKNGRDYIYRYTGGKASPKITWKFERFDPIAGESGVYVVVEAKYVDGVKAHDKDGNLIVRYPTGEYGNTYFVLNGNKIEYWVVDAANNRSLLATFENYTGNLGGLIDAYVSGSLRVQATIPATPAAN